LLSNFRSSGIQKFGQGRRWWLTPVILATQKGEIRWIVVRNQPGQIVRETLTGKYPTQKRAGRAAQGVGPEFKFLYHQNKKKQNSPSLNPVKGWWCCFNHSFFFGGTGI
jgi:hypothetical protein